MKNNFSDRKLLLFDIDGTLILSGGRGKQAIIAAAQDEFQQPLEFEFLPFAGMTDRWILAELIKKNHLPQGDIETRIDRILGRYLAHLKSLMVSPATVEVLPGVRALLQTVTLNGEFAVGLVTGNIEAGARIKLEPAGLNDYFSFGAFGDDGADRNLLPPIAVQRAEALLNEKFQPENIWIIGDTPKDIECAKTNGYRSLALATGGWSVEELYTHQPDVATENLAEVEQILTTFRS